MNTPENIQTTVNTENDYVIKIKIGDHFIDPRCFINSVELFNNTYYNKYDTMSLEEKLNNLIN